MSDALFDDAPVAYVLTDEAGCIQRVNRALLTWTGRTESELVFKQRIQDLLTADSRIDFESHLAPLIALHDEVNDVVLKFASRDGEPIFAVGTLKRTTDIERGSTQIWFAFINASVSEHFENDARRARARLERLQRLASALAVAVTVDEIVTAALVEILDGVKGDHGFVAIVAGETLRIRQSFGFANHDELAKSELAFAAFPEASEVLASGTAAFVERVDQAADREPTRHIDGRRTTRYALLPLTTGRRTDGVLCVASSTRVQFDSDEQSFLVLFAELTAQGLQVAKLHDDTARRAQQASFIAQMSRVLDDTMSFTARCQRLVDLLVPELADLATVECATNDPVVVSVAHRDPSKVAKLRELRTSVQVSANQPYSLATARATHEPQVLVHVTPDVYDRYDLGPHERELLGEIAPRSYVGLPMLARGNLVATLLLAMSDSDRHYEHDDVAYLTDIANRAAVSLDNARLYDHERSVAGSFQRELLGRPLPTHERLQLRAVYHAGGELVEIGGDYFDSFFVGGDRIAIAVGDVVGRGIPAATVMGQLRTALRAFALEGHGPAETLNRLEVFATSIPGSAFSTVAYAEFDLQTNELVYACAGHPPPILISESLGPVVLWDARSPLLGINQETPRAEGRIHMEPGSTVLLYTDGLVEARTRSLDQGIADLVSVLGDDPVIDLDTLVKKLNVDDEHQDDICILAMTFTADEPEEQERCEE